MEIRISVPHGTDVSIIERHFCPDMYNDIVNDEDGEDVYFDCVGEDEDDYEDATRIEAEEICGAVEAVYPDADCRPDGCDLWGTYDMRHRENYKRGAEMAKAGFLDFRFLSEAGRASRGFPAKKSEGE